MAPLRRRTAIIGTVVLAILLLASCGVDEDQLAGGGGNNNQIDDIVPTDSTQPTSTIPPLDETDLRNVAADVQDYWEETMPEVYDQPYEVIPDERIIAGTPDSQFPTCDTEQIGYSDVEGNAFAAPCPEGITVVWDDAQLIPELSERFGAIAPAIVLAHEWGHVVQFEADVEEPTVIMEQQADCFAGAWLADLMEAPGGLSDLVEENPLDTSLASIIEFRDQPGSSPEDENAHGTGFDRVRALQEGFEQGPTHCEAYPEKPPALIDLQFTTEDDFTSGGNLPLEELIPLVVQDLNDFYGEQVPDFQGSSEQAVLASDDAVTQLTDLHERIGDNGAGVVLALVWARFAQEQTGADEGRDEFGQQLQRACLTGGWFLEVLNRSPDTAEGSIIFSPGDVDEAIIGLIDLGTQGVDSTADGGLFRLVASLRQGITEGFDSCGLP